MNTKLLICAFFLVFAGLTGCVKDEVYQNPPTISDFTLEPAVPGTGEAVKVTAIISDSIEIKGVNLYYRLGQESLQSIPMSLQAKGSSGMYSGTLPAQNTGVIVSFYIEAENTAGMKSYYPGGAPQVMSSYTVGVPSLVINELFSRGGNEDPDWVEILNPSDIEIDISGYRIYDEGGQTGTKPKKVFPAGSLIPAGGFFVIVVDDGTESGFGLSSTGEEIWFENPEGGLLDHVVFPELGQTQSYGRLPDGSSVWTVLNTVTRGSSNQQGVISGSDITINEIYSRGTPQDPDWVELYNYGTQTVDLSGWKIYDSGGHEGAKPKMELPSGTQLSPGAFLVVVVDVETASGFGLSSTGEVLWLEKPDGTVKEEFVFPALDEGTSFGRFPDGTSNLQVLFVPTPGQANDNSNPQPPAVIKINEIYSRGDGAQPDWIEVYNAGQETVELSGWKIFDNGGHSGAKPKLEFPAGAGIAPGGFFVIVVDDGSAAGFGLSSDGETVWLENPEGSIVDEVVFPVLDINQSYGRYPDGGSNFQVLNVVTPGTPNDNTSPGPSVIIKMNEIFSRGIPSDPDWIEIFNASEIDVDLTGWKIFDAGGQGGTKPKKEFPSGTMIPSGGFFVIITDTEDAGGFGLSSGGETVWLENSSGAVVDEVVFPALAENQSYGRKPDGSSNLVIFTEITKGTSNNQAASLPK